MTRPFQFLFPHGEQQGITRASDHCRTLVLFVVCPINHPQPLASTLLLMVGGYR
jgi:hypothetical protein